MWRGAPARGRGEGAPLPQPRPPSRPARAALSGLAVRALRSASRVHGATRIARAALIRPGPLPNNVSVFD